MKKIYTIVLLAVLASTSAKSQLVVSSSQTPTQWVQSLFQGSGVIVSNVTYVGAPTASGQFSDTLANIGFGSGILLTTGDINNAIGPNNQTWAYTNNLLNGDIDLDSIMHPSLSFDVAVLEFDFIPVGDTVIFKYSFASEEYMAYANTNYNDGFGFFLSGPGITGPYSNNAQNIALIPGTSIPVTINNVNLNTNGQYYVDNGDGAGTGTAPDGLYIQYNGYTVPFYALAVVVPGQTYHIKLVIGDCSDGVFDSGVFLEGYSFSSIVSAPSQLRAANHFCPDDSVYTLVAPSGFSSYQWFYPNGKFIHAADGGTNDTLWVHNPTFGEVYRLVMVPVNNIGTILSDTLAVSADNNCLSTSITNVSNNSNITISPNPFTSQTTITISSTNNQQLTTLIVSDVLGHEIKNIRFSGHQYVLEKGDLSAGIYFVQLTDENKNCINKKIIIQ